MAANEPLVVCVTPTYGRAHLLKEMLWCWVSQTYKNKRLIILNDQENLTLTCKVPGVEVINAPTRFPALGAKRNYLNGLIPEDADYVIPMDDDDLFLPNYIERFVTALEAHPDCDRVKNKLNYVAMNNIYHGVDTGNQFFGASCFRASTLRHSWMNPSYVMGEDTDMMLRSGIKTYDIDDGKGTFIYRLGMGIVHASGHGGHLVSDPATQQAIHQKIAESTPQYTGPTTLELVPELSFMAAQVYTDVTNLTWKGAS
jgi:glycosyltransferase involved in cell wall biosynthesis